MNTLTRPGRGVVTRARPAAIFDPEPEIVSPPEPPPGAVSCPVCLALVPRHYLILSGELRVLGCWDCVQPRGRWRRAGR